MTRSSLLVATFLVATFSFSSLAEAQHGHGGRLLGYGNAVGNTNTEGIGNRLGLLSMASKGDYWAQNQSSHWPTDRIDCAADSGDATKLFLGCITEYRDASLPSVWWACPYGQRRRSFQGDSLLAEPHEPIRRISCAWPLVTLCVVLDKNA